jgi:hypothetical protein
MKKILSETLDPLAVRDCIVAGVEPDEPDTIARIVEGLKGKLVSSAHLKLFPGGAERWRIRREYGMTYLESTGYANARMGRKDFDRKDYYSFLLGWSETNVHWGEPAPNYPEKTFESVNSCYFEARRERNKKRELALDTAPQLWLALEALRHARIEVARREAAVAAFTEYDQPFNPDSTALMALIETD